MTSAMRSGIIAWLTIALGAAACGGDVRSSSSHAKHALAFQLSSANLVFCHCRHGCGPGLDGSIGVTARNDGTESVALHVTALHFLGATTLDVTTDSGLLGQTQPVTLAPNESRALTFSLQPDVANDFPPGDYELELWLDDAAAHFALGSTAIPYEANPNCGP
jgi:hypothetical protein